MRIAAISALGALLAAGSSAFAQSPYLDRDRNDGRSSAYGAQRNDNSRDSYRGYHDDDDRKSARYSRWRDNDDDDGKHHRHWRGGKHHRMGHYSGGPGFFMKSGDKAFGVDCGSDATLSECADAAMKMFRQMQQAHSAMSGADAKPARPGATTNP